MIDEETAREGSRALSTAIAELMEDVVDDAARFGHSGDRPSEAALLAAACRDIGVLAQALAVISRGVS